MAGNLRLAKNALMLYGRTLITTVVGIVTVRLTLQALGVDDYGLLNVAGSLAGVFSFVTVGLSVGVSRFMTFELGRGDIWRMRRTFSSSIIAFVAISALFVILGETIGLWYLRNYLTVPAGSENAAFWVFQASILTVVTSFIRVPYNGIIISHEKFNVHAMMETLYSVLKLGVVVYVSGLEENRVIILAFIYAVLPLVYLATYIIYTRRYPETHVKIHFDKALFKPIVKFSSWEILGSVSKMLKTSGFNMVVNFFCGVAMHATIGIANTVSGAVIGLAYNLSGVFYPGMVKAYAKKNMLEFSTLTYRASLGSMILYGIVAMPLIAECDYVLHLWLGNSPRLSPQLCLIFLIADSLLMAQLVGAEAIKAAGKNRALNLLQSLSAALAVGLVFIALYGGLSPLTACALFSLDVLFSLSIVAFLMARNFGVATTGHFLKNSVVKVLFLELAVYLLLRMFCSLMEPSFLRLLLSCLLSVVSFAILTYSFLLTPDERSSLVSVLRSRLKPAI